MSCSLYIWNSRIIAAYTCALDRRSCRKCMATSCISVCVQNTQLQFADTTQHMQSKARSGERNTFLILRNFLLIIIIHIDLSGSSLTLIFLMSLGPAERSINPRQWHKIIASHGWGARLQVCTPNMLWYKSANVCFLFVISAESRCRFPIRSSSTSGRQLRTVRSDRGSPMDTAQHTGFRR